MISAKYYAPYTDPSGYGMAARYYITNLIKQGVNVEAIPRSFWKGSFKIEAEMKKMLDDAEKVKLSDDVPLICHQTPNHFNVHYPGPKIGYTVHETTGIVREWANYINQMDECWTASDFSKEVFETSGVTTPIYKIQHGVDRDIFNEDVEPLKLNINDDTFKFLSVFQWIFRKGFDKLLKAYYQEFTPEDNVAMVIKTFGYSEGMTELKRIHNEIMSIQREVRVDEAPPVYILSDFYTYTDMARLYNSADSFVMPTRGEAWGIPLIEAMSCGLPTIATDWSGQKEFMNKRNSLLVDIDELSVVRGMHVPWLTTEQRWAEPCLIDLRNKMRSVYEDEKLCRRLSSAGIKTAKKFPWSKPAKVMKRRLKTFG